MSVVIGNILVLYNSNDPDSYEFASYYANARGLNSIQLVPVNCSSSEILPNYAAFQSQVETPLLEHVASLYSEYVDEYVAQSVRYVLVGYGVPGGFYDAADVISAQSRLSRLNHAYSKKLSNPLYGRAIYRPFDTDDEDVALIVSRIDAPTLELAKGMIDSIGLVARQARANGRFFFDKDFVVSGSGLSDYQSDLSDFETLTLPQLNMKTSKTVHWDEYTDVPLFRLTGDSFTWAAMSDRAGYTFFQPSKTARFFLYNADTDGGFTLRNIDERRWPLLAMSSGYAATAGASSDPGTDGYLRPKPFFDALLQGATIGEAFMYACPYLNWTVGLFGDPLIKVKFPFGSNISPVATANVAFSLAKNMIADAVGFATNRQLAYAEIREIINAGDFSTVTEILPAAFGLDTLGNQVRTTYSKVASGLFRFGAQSSNVNDYLTANSFTVSQLVANIGGIFPDPSLVYEAGTWFAEDAIQHDNGGYLTYAFELEAANDDQFTDIFLNVTTATSVMGWEYEKEPNVFYPFPTSGVTSSYAGLRIRYSSTENMDAGTVFYVRFRQLDNLSRYTDWRVFTKVVST